jgi:DNA-binding response OmpR family regulator
MAKILIIEDDPNMQIGLKDNLEIEGYDVEIAKDGKIGLQRIVEHKYDLILLDGMLPFMSGFDILKKARAQGIGTPIIMLTAKGEEIDKVLGLELGADDYITKPFSLREMLARVKAVLRRREGAGSQTIAEKLIIGKLELDFASYRALRSGKPVDMTPKEFEIVKFLWQHQNQTVSREQLLTNVWGYDDSITTRTVDNFISKLRQKIEANAANPQHIITIHGVGYKLIL